jgi:transcription elongation factor Elf1
MMPDREKVIKALTDALSAKENYPWAKAEMSFEFIEMLLELLKEQEAVVRCKDCRQNGQCSIQFKFADADDPGNWFCAYGKRKEGR